MAVNGEASHGISDSIVTEFATYEDFLDSQITPTDLYYLEVSYMRGRNVRNWIVEYAENKKNP